MATTKRKDTDPRETWIVELEEGCWLAPWLGDPGRTTMKKSARDSAPPMEHVVHSDLQDGIDHF